MRMNPVPIASQRLAMFAHQGGWDEMLMVAAPLGFIGLMLWLANKRVDAKLEAHDADTE